MRRFLFACSVLAGLAVTQTPAMATVEVIATIKPLHSLLAALTNGVGKVSLLIDGEKTPYGYEPDDATKEKLNKADLVVWMGPELENSVAPLLSGKEHAYEMLSDPEFKVLTQRGDAGGRDPYMWLDVRNAEVFVDALFDRLVQIDPANEKAYVQNRDKLKQEVAALDRKFEFGFRAVAAGQSWVYHDTQQYFEQSYAFKVRGILSSKPGQEAHAGNLLKARAELSDIGGYCVFVEKGMTQNHLPLLTSAGNAHVKVLDSFGLGFKAGPALYIDMMRHNFDTIASCFKEIGAKYTGPSIPQKK